MAYKNKVASNKINPHHVFTNNTIHIAIITVHVVPDHNFMIKLMVK